MLDGNVCVELSVGRNTAILKRAAKSLAGVFCSEETENYSGGLQNI